MSHTAKTARENEKLAREKDPTERLKSQGVRLNPGF